MSLNHCWRCSFAEAYLINFKSVMVLTIKITWLL